MDACGNAETGYISRGERELEPYMECLWDLFSSIPSIYEEGRTVLDETRETNRNFPINSCHRLWDKGFVPVDETDLGISEPVKQQFMKMMMTPEEEIEYVTIEQWFSKDFFESNLWYYWSAMLAFQPYQSLIEMKRYAVRFIHQLHLIKSLKGILRTKYDQYHSLILPLQKYLEDHGVKFVANTTVTDMEFYIQGKEKTVTALNLLCDGKEETQPVAADALVFFTNGSMTQNSTRGSMTEPAKIDLNTERRGCFTLWEKLAAKCDGFGHPEKFTSDPYATHFVSVTMTIKDYPELFEYLEKMTGNKTGAGGATTFVHSPWYITYGAALQPLEPDQPDNVQVLWFYGLHSNELGEYVKKPMTDCSGEEILQELLYFFGLEDKYEEIKEHSILIPTIMPYITSQFMPRGLNDRPTIIPEGSKNLAFIGQFVELPGDVVFTVETSVRTAMTAVYRMLHLDRPVDPLFQGHFDIRMVKAAAQLILGKDELEASDLPKINPFKLRKTMNMLLDFANAIPEVPEYYLDKIENQ